MSDNSKIHSEENRVATVGSPSSNYEVTLDVSSAARGTPLVGSVVYLENPMGEGSELALGTVTEVVTTNKWHEDPTFRGLLRATGEIAGMSGDEGDIRRANIRIQAAWKRENRKDYWKASGPNLRMSPATGTPVCKVNDKLVAELIAGANDISYMGHLGGAENIPLPLSIPDFASSLGALHMGVYGLSGSGKALDLNTPIPTPTGWTKMGDLKNGDIVFGADGVPCRVVEAHEIRDNRSCYNVVFSDGSSILADADHLWQTYSPLEHSSHAEGVVLTTLDIARTLTVDPNKGISNHAIPNTLPLQLPEATLAKSPKIFGTEIKEAILLGDKKITIPIEYLRASESQRLELLETIIDGTVETYGNTNTLSTRNEKLTQNIGELLLSLGKQVSLFSSGSEHQVFWSNILTTRYILSVEPAPTRPVRCITVDSEDSLYLAGESMIPTHNTAVTSYLLASQMRWEQHGIIIIDPQGQWSSEQELPFSLQGFASELGREVIVRRISEDLKLEKDASLMTNLLQHTKIVVELGLKHENTQEIVWYEISKALRAREDWTDDDSALLLRKLLEYLVTDDAANRVYTTPDNASRFQQRVGDLLTNEESFKTALHQFAPIHNLFQAKNPSGGYRHSLKSTIESVFNKTTSSAPLLILDMSSKAPPGLDEEVEEATEKAYEILERDAVKAAVLRNLFQALKRSSEAQFRSGTNLNTLVVLDEAWRYAAPPSRVEEEELQLLSKDLAGYARDTRKFGIGWLYISQSTRSVNLDIWDQMSIRLFGYGLNGADLDKMAEVIDDRSVLRLYRSSGNPRSTGVYPFMMTGPVSPLAANATPVMLNVYTDVQAFRADNHHWIRPIREKLGLKILSGEPAPFNPKKAPGKPKNRVKVVKDVRSAVIDSNKAARENRQATGTTDPAGFSDPLSNLDDESVPF
jgi:hypothetical protein